VTTDKDLVKHILRLERLEGNLAQDGGGGHN